MKMHSLSIYYAACCGLGVSVRRWLKNRNAAKGAFDTQLSAALP